MRRLILILSVVVVIIAISWILYDIYHNSKNRNELVLYGNVDVRQVDIGFRVAGRVKEVLFEEGDVVRRGDLMATLEESPYDSQLQSAQANWDQIQASLSNATTQLKRRQELIGIQGVSGEELSNAESAQIQQSATLAQAEASLQVAKDNLSFTKAYAPNDGIVLTRVREPGSVVNISDTIYTLSLTNPIWVRAFIAEPQLGLICYGMRAEVFTDAPDGKPYEGAVGFISPSAEFTPKTVETTELRTDLVYRLRIYIQEADQGLKQGMPVTVKLKLPCAVKSAP
jgi:HlyD family secretion protein